MKTTWLQRAAKCIGLTALLWMGCIPSLQPFYTDKDLTFESALVGSFSEDNDAPVWTFTKQSESAYHLVIRDKAKRSPFKAHLFKLAGEFYLDLYPGDNSLEDCPREDFFKSSLVPGHLCVRVAQIQPSLKIQVLEEDAIKEILKNSKGAFPHSLIEGERLVFTGSTDQMQSFLRKIQKDEKAWGKPAELTTRSTTK